MALAGFFLDDPPVCFPEGLRVGVFSASGEEYLNTDLPVFSLPGGGMTDFGRFDTCLLFDPCSDGGTFSAECVPLSLKVVVKSGVSDS